MSDHSPRKDCLQVGGALIMIAACLFYRSSQTTPVVFCTIGLILVVVGLIWNKGARWFSYTWFRLTRAIATVNTTVLLGVVYFIIITPTGFVIRSFKKKSTDTDESFWRTPEHNSTSMKDQF